MEKQAKNMIMRFLPKSAAISFRPDANRRNKFRTHLSGKAFSGPIAPSKNSSETSQEPSSPKVSCMGQIKHKKRMICKSKKQPSLSLPKEFKPKGSDPADQLKKKKKQSKAPERAPSLSQMRRFASGHETLGDFDWTSARIEAGDEQDHGFVVPVWMGGDDLRLEPRKEINLWKRRTMAQPKRLQLSRAN